MPKYPSGYYGVSTGSTYNNVVTRRLAIKDRVAFAQSSRFGGQWIEPKGAPVPYNGTIIDAVGAIQQLVNELNLISPILPDLGEPVILSQVGLATNILRNNVGVAVSFIGDMQGTIGTALNIDGVGIGTNTRVLFYGLTTAALNGVYNVNYNNPNVLATGITTLNVPLYTFSRAQDLRFWWQFCKPKAYVVAGGTNNRGSVFSLQSDAWELGNAFAIATGTAVTQLAGTSITFTATNYSPNSPSGVNAAILGTVGAGNTSVISPAYNPSLNLNTGEYDFLSQASMAKFIHLKNRARRLAYHVFKLRENYTPFVSQYQNNVITAIGAGNTDNNIGFSIGNDLPAQGRYPSGFNRGF